MIEVLKSKIHRAKVTGAAARKVQVGDLINILSYTWIDKNEYDRYNPVIVIADKL